MSHAGRQWSFLLAFAKSTAYAKIRVMMDSWMYAVAASRIAADEDVDAPPSTATAAATTDDDDEQSEKEDEIAGATVANRKKVKIQHVRNSTFCHCLRCWIWLDSMFVR